MLGQTGLRLASGLGVGDVWGGRRGTGGSSDRTIYAFHPVLALAHHPGDLERGALGLGLHGGHYEGHAEQGQQRFCVLEVLVRHHLGVSRLWGGGGKGGWGGKVGKVGG